jgi:hypothetical protein
LAGGATQEGVKTEADDRAPVPWSITPPHPKLNPAVANKSNACRVVVFI